MGTRRSEHMGTLNPRGKLIKNAKELAISDYLLQWNSPITFDNFNVLASVPNKFILLMQERLLIKHD